MILLNATRSVIAVALALLLVGIVALSLFARAETSFVIRGRSMEPAIPIGSLISLETVHHSQLRVDDVVTVRADNGAVITHRIIGVVESADEHYIKLQGDANATPDAALVPVRAVEGRVAFYVPLLGFVVALLSMPAGFVSLLCLLGSGILVIKLLEQLEEERRAAGAEVHLPDAVTP